jgi:lipoyl-dependent peroxiredoxin
MAHLRNRALHRQNPHGGRDGACRSEDGRLGVKLSPPGSPGAGTNPEQSFAAGWSACVIEAMGRVGAP